MGSPRRNQDDMPKVDLESPRMIAAMKVTGIDRSEVIEPKEPEGDALKSEGEERRFDLMERKRRQLLKDLDDAAAALDESLVEAILSPTAQEAAMAQDARSLLESQKAKIDERKDRAKSEMQKELEREISRMQAYDNTQRSREDWRKRAKEKQDEKVEHLAKMAEETQKRVEKQGEALRKNKIQLLSARKATMKRIDDTNERVEKQAEERKGAWELVSEDRRKKMAEIAQKNMDIQRIEEEDKIRKAGVASEKQREREERMTRVAEEALNTKRSKFADKMGSVSDQMQKQQMERERMFKENTERLERARQAGKERQAEIVERTRTARDKEMDKWTLNRDARRKENREKITKLKTEISDGHAKSVEVREKFLEETVYKKAEMKGCLSELVEQNKSRISRAEECAREQTLAKIRHTKDKISTLSDQRKLVSEYRTSALKDEMIGRTQVSELKTLMRDASTKRINQILKDMDMPPLQAPPVKEEGEDDKKQ